MHNYIDSFDQQFNNLSFPEVPTEKTRPEVSQKSFPVLLIALAGVLLLVGIIYLNNQRQTKCPDEDLDN
jgi:hypothetical protein